MKRFFKCLAVIFSVLAISTASASAASLANDYETLVYGFVVGKEVNVPDGVHMMTDTMGTCGRLRVIISGNPISAVQIQSAQGRGNTLPIANEIIEMLSELYGAPDIVTPDGTAVWTGANGFAGSYTAADGIIAIERQ